MDSFDHYAVASFGNKWSAINSGNPGGGGMAGGRSGNCIYFTRGGNAHKVLSSSQSTFIVGFASCAVPTIGPLVALYDNGNRKVYLQAGVSGTISAYSVSTLLATSAVNVLPPTGWFYIEMKTLIAVAGTVEVRVNGVTVLSFSGNTTISGNATANTLWLVGYIGDYNELFYYDDLYLCDGSGATNNDFLGDCRVEALFPSGAGATAAWTRGGTDSGANWSQVDEATPNNDTDYNKSNTIGQTDTYAMTDLVSATGIIYGVQKMNYVRKDNAGGRSVAPVLCIGGTDYVGAATSIGDSYVYTREIEEISPSTLAAFTISEVNALETGIVVTA